MASEKEKTGKREQTQSKNEKGHENRQPARSEQNRESSQSEMHDRGQASHAERGGAQERSGGAQEHRGQEKGEQKSNRSTPKVKMPKLEAGKSNRTTDHDVIRQWVEDRGGSPAAVKATEGKEDPGLLRINFPGYSGKYSLEDISWDEFFQKFDEKNLEFLYQDQTKGGKTSRFFKLVNRTGGEHGRGGSTSKDKEGSSGKERSESRSHSESRSRSKEKEK